MTDADQRIVLVGIAVTDTSEETNQLVIVHVTAHIGVVILIRQERTVVQIVPEECCGREVGIAGAEAVVLIIEVAVTYDGVETVLVPLRVVA